MKVLFTGSRELGDGRCLRLAGKAAAAEISELHADEDVIIHGGAHGFDSLVDFIARNRGFKPRVVTPNYRIWPGNIAPIKRDEEMVNMCDRVVAFWNGISHGTKATINFAIAGQKPVRLYTIQGDHLRLKTPHVRIP